jgi:hypothetical protein
VGTRLLGWWRNDGIVGWVMTLVIMGLAFGLRIVGLGQPHEFSFDETYYAKDAWALWHDGYATNWCSSSGTACPKDAIADAHLKSGETADANTLILHGIAPCRLILYVSDKDATADTNQDCRPATPGHPDPEMAVHPEVGKWFIGLGEELFGMTPFGWRIGSVIIGTLMIGVFIRFVRRLTRSNLLAGFAGLLLTFDGLQLVLSRLALLDIYVAFFTLLAVHLLVKDRDWLRAHVSADPAPGRWRGIGRVLWRPWLAASGVAWGLGLGSKWDVIYPMLGFGLLFVAWGVGARRRAGIRRPFPRTLLADGVPALLMVVLAVVVYVASWSGWLVHHSAYEQSAMSHSQYTSWSGHGKCDGQNWVDLSPKADAHWSTVGSGGALKHETGLGGMLQPFLSLWDYHQDVYVFHTVFLQCSTHPYASQPEGWPLLNRPVGISAENDIKPGARSNPDQNSSTQTCSAPAGSTCLRQVTALGTPVLWWGCAIGALCAIGLWAGARDWRAGVAVVGAATTWVPWFMYGDRTIFSYYAISMLPFTILATVLCIGRLLSGSPNRRTAAAILGGTFLVLVILNFAWFWPIWTDGMLTRISPVTLGNFWGNWLSRMWFLKWI